MKKERNLIQAQTAEKAKRVVLSKQFIESQQKIILERIARYTNRQRIVDELGSNDVSPYILYKQKEVVPQLQKALKIIEQGEYGICLACGGNIEMKRLVVVPAAFVCISCMLAGKTGN